MATMYPCPSCGGQLVFSPSKQKLKCKSCGNLTDADSYNGSDRVSISSITTNVYSCPTCGGEIQLIDNDGMEFCPFCGNQATMEEHFSTEGAPKYILPFAIGKKAARNSYQKYAGKISYAPEGLDNEENINKMVGLYVPYNVYEYSVNDTIEYKGTHSYSRGSYDYTDYANINANVDIQNLKVPFDASQSLDDTVSEQIEPFPSAQIRDFNPNYLAGFYVENSTVDSDLYVEDSVDKAADYLYKKVVDDAKGYEPDGRSAKLIKERLKSDLVGCGVGGAYFPIYFMTTKYNDRVAYSIVNGASGAAYMDMPIEKSKMFKGGLMASGITFVILFLFSLIANTIINIKSMCGFGALISAVIAYTGAYLANASYRKDNHLDDKGFYQNRDSVQKKKVKVKKKNGQIFIMLPIFLMGGLLFGIFSFGSKIVSIIATLGYPISVVLIIMALFKIHKGKKKVLLLGMLGWIASIVIRFMNMVNDIYYYGALAIAFIVILLSITEMVNTYNVFATRPSPQFLKKGGGLDSVKEQ